MKQRLLIGILALFILSGIVPVPAPVMAAETPDVTEIVSAEETEETNSTGVSWLLIAMGLGAVAAVGGYYYNAQRQPSGNEETTLEVVE